jgi:hypothetical protein
MVVVLELLNCIKEKLHVRLFCLFVCLFINGINSFFVFTVDTAETTLDILHYVYLKLRGTPALDKRKLLAIAVILRDLQNVIELLVVGG